MRIALLTDIHSNREALEACLTHAAANGAERYVFLGDYVGYGADPGFVVDTVSGFVARGATALMGNHDAAVLRAGRAGMNDYAAIALEWTRDQLTPAQRDFLAKRPLTHHEGDRLYVHASAHVPQDWDYVADIESAAQSFGATTAQLTFCGHVHVPMLYHLTSTGKLASSDPGERVEIPITGDGRWLVVVGSVGQPRDQNPAACYAMLDDATDKLTFFRIPYDIDKAAEKIRRAGLPEWLATRLFDGM
jgi:diadenosine tetraphosphatase ApaH/serine/threonine PP2A family protein phosphatase